ncbi:putative nuclease of restriction endonuclease-like (RecB) superfamily [Pseudomonas lini]|nr:putative nuclease of restriction endonuclease-like (RecB) superfamily [Pseudomonas lini]
MIIFSQSKRPQEREFYVRMAVQEKWSKRELERQFKEYQVQLPDKQLLQAKLHEFYALNIAQGEGTE